MNDMAIWEHRISKAKSLEALSDLRRDFEATMTVEHRPQADRDDGNSMFDRARERFAEMLAAG